MNEQPRLQSRQTKRTPEEIAEQVARDVEWARLKAVSRSRRNSLNPKRGTYVVYRVFSTDGELLYVGASMSFLSRMQMHRSEGWWIREVDERLTTIEVFPDLASTSEREMMLIRDLQPRFNRAGVSSHALPYIGVSQIRDGK